MQGADKHTERRRVSAATFLPGQSVAGPHVQATQGSYTEVFGSH